MADKGWILMTLTETDLDRAPYFGELRKEYNFVEWTDYNQNPEQYSDKIKIILSSPTTHKPEILHEETLKKMVNLQAVTTCSVGIDHLDLPLLKKLGIKVSHASNTTKDIVADHAFCLMMAAAKRLPESIEAARGYEEGDHINIQRNFRCTGSDIFGATLGIVGMGDIGFEVAKRAQGFRMKILYHNRNQRNREDEEAVSATFCPTLKDLLPDVDFLVVSVPLTKSTENMIGREQFQIMKRTAYIINVARGPNVNTNDLVEALRNKVIAGAALDVTNPEPLPDHHPLLHMPNVIVTPHMSTFTVGGMKLVFKRVVENVRAAMEDKPIPGEYKFT